MTYDFRRSQNDIILKVTGSTICGSDLHLYHSEIVGLQKGDILGHEFAGIVDKVCVYTWLDRVAATGLLTMLATAFDLLGWAYSKLFSIPGRLSELHN